MKYDVPIFHLNQRKPLNHTSKKKACNGRDRTDLAPFTHIDQDVPYFRQELDTA